jgi:hypothetical protein
MPNLKLGRRTVASLPPVVKPTVFYNSELTGFGLKVFPSVPNLGLSNIDPAMEVVAFRSAVWCSVRPKHLRRTKRETKPQPYWRRSSLALTLPEIVRMAGRLMTLQAF